MWNQHSAFTSFTWTCDCLWFWSDVQCAMIDNPSSTYTTETMMRVTKKKFACVCQCVKSEQVKMNYGLCVIVCCEQPNEMDGTLTLDTLQKMSQSAVNIHTSTNTFVFRHRIEFVEFRELRFICFDFWCVAPMMTERPPNEEPKKTSRVSKWNSAMCSFRSDSSTVFCRCEAISFKRSTAFA